MPATVRELTIAQVVARLTERFPRTNVRHVTATVSEEYDALAGNPIRIYVPNLIEQAARKRLNSEPALAA